MPYVAWNRAPMDTKRRYFEFGELLGEIVVAAGPAGYRELVKWLKGLGDEASVGIEEITARSRLRVPVEIIVRDLNRFLRGWAGYFRYGNSAQFFDKITRYALMRLAGFIAKP